MNKEFLKTILVVIGAVLFNIIFWQEKMAINVLLFDAFILWSVFYLYPSGFEKPVMKWLLTAHIITLSAVIIQNTFLSKIAFGTTLIMVVVFFQYRHRSIWYAVASATMNYLFAGPSFFGHIRLIQHKPVNLSGLRKALHFLVIPFILLLVFFLLYNFANAVFKSLLSDIGIAFEHFFSRFFTRFNWQRASFLLLGLFITAGLLLKSNISYFSDADIIKKNDLVRKKNDLLKWHQTSWFGLLSVLMGRFASGVMALRNENKTAVISLGLLNGLLLCINCVDVICVWFGFKYGDDVNLSQYVHDGTGLLIFSILLAMVLLLFFFRGNLNFYRQNKLIRSGAYVWLIQNAVLAISVLFRDYYYIQQYGLAYKRIGVLIFLLLVLTGLLTVFVKIHQRKTTYYLLRVNAWFIVIALVISSCINWDEVIARYNLAKKDTIVPDIEFLLTLSDKVLPLLENNPEILDKGNIGNTGNRDGYKYMPATIPREIFEKRKKQFSNAQTHYTWLSWNMADEYVKRELNKITPTSYLK